MELNEPITTRHASAVGLTPDQLRSNRWTAPFRGVYVDRGAEQSLLTTCRALAAVARVPVVASDRTAAELYGWWLAHSPDLIVHISVATGDRVERLNVRCHRRRFEPDDVCQHNGIQITAPARTILDLASQLPLIDLVVVIDAALHMRSCTLDELIASAKSRGTRGLRNLRKALTLCDARSESPMETLHRLVIVLSGLPAPIPQAKIYDAHGAFVARADLRAPGVRAVFEYDGADHNKPGTHAVDVRRWRALRAAGYEVFPYTAGDLFRAPQHIVVDYQGAVGLPIDASAVQGWLREWKHSGFNT